MKRRLRHIPHGAAFVLFAAIGAGAAENPHPPATGASRTQDETLYTFGRAQAKCLEWSDSCSICGRTRRLARADRPWSRRGGIKLTCSTPGIACLPREISCSREEP